MPPLVIISLHAAVSRIFPDKTNNIYFRINTGRTLLFYFMGILYSRGDWGQIFAAAGNALFRAGAVADGAEDRLDLFARHGTIGGFQTVPVGFRIRELDQVDRDTAEAAAA